ncbi:MAG: PAS domain S-box protein [Methanoregula sp.]
MISLLYVDDEPDLLDLGKIFLEGNGTFSVTRASSGEEGISLMAGQDFDAIVSDYQMPGMDGIDFLKKVRSSHENIPFILLTGRGREDVVIEATKNGADFYLQKGGVPRAEFAELAHTIMQAISRRKAESDLRESKEKYRLIAENSPDMIFVFDTDGYLTYVNSLAAEVMQTKPEPLIGRHLSEIFRPDTAKRYMEAVRRVIDTRKPLRSETFEEFPSGGTWIHVRLTPLVSASGSVIGVLGLSHDISDRKRAEEALRESEMKYRVLVENSHDIIYTISPGGILTFVSPGWTALLGHDTAYVTGKPFQSFIHPADIPACDAALANVVASKERQSGIEYRAIHANGTIRFHTSTISPIFDDHGQVISYIGSARDITEMKQVQNAIRESNRKLNLLSSITRHDVANQLTVVQGYAQLAALRKPEPVIADFLLKISSAVDTIQSQIEFTRSYQDLGVQAPAWHPVGNVVRSVRPPGIELDCTCESCEIFTDPMIAKVFFNLFDNAVRYGERVTMVTVACERAGDELIITFADNGVGIPLNEKQKIFEKGYGRHTGFGLFLVREILSITRISIHETGSHGKGARFEIAVPNGAYRKGR